VTLGCVGAAGFAGFAGYLNHASGSRRVFFVGLTPKWVENTLWKPGARLKYPANPAHPAHGRVWRGIR